MKLKTILRLLHYLKMTSDKELALAINRMENLLEVMKIKLKKTQKMKKKQRKQKRQTKFLDREEDQYYIKHLRN